MNLDFSQHALARVRQRGLRESDIQVIVEAGTPVDDDSSFCSTETWTAKFANANKRSRPLSGYVVAAWWWPVKRS